MRKINIKDLKNQTLTTGEKILLSGVVYTARDAAHKKIFEIGLENCPFKIENSVIYYAGPTPTSPTSRLAIGSCGPTTSCRMDKYAPALYDKGLLAVIGKGERSDEVKNAVLRNKGFYFLAIGGCGAIYAKCIKSCEVIAFPELGPESIKRLTLEDFAVAVA
ncbi:MAG: fumarate hydratase C-terminal domain-containing protein [Ruminococcus sp.]|jgi:fumarate hydratase subunit beta|nr:fumarate hydratase C-terminal domain-containing protein [Ruminococcus sp.]